MRGGFPDSVLAKDDAHSLRWRRDFIRSYLERDIQQLGPRIAVETLRRFWIMVAHQQGGMLNSAEPAGIDDETIEAFESKLKDNLYRIWNRMSSGSYFPPAVKAVEIPKADGKTRLLGIPTVGDRIVQTVVKMQLELVVELKFHRESYGYRPGKFVDDLLAHCRNPFLGAVAICNPFLQKQGCCIRMAAYTGILWRHQANS